MMMTQLSCAGPPAATAAQAALASLSKIKLSASDAPSSTATTSEISDDISEMGHPIELERCVDLQQFVITPTNLDQ